MYCSKCGKELSQDSRFCPNCGNSVDSSTLLPTQTPSGQEQIAPSTKQQNIPPVLEQNTPPAPQQNTPSASEQDMPSVPNEEIKCPKCGAVGCTPQYKQNISGGGYGCCSGGLGALVLGPLGLLCGMCGRSTKTTNTLVWICPKCGHEFHTRSKKDMKAIYVAGCCIFAFYYFWLAIVNTAYYDIGAAIVPGVFLMILLGAAFYYVVWDKGVCKARVAYTDEEKQQLKTITIITAAISFICALAPAIF